jgi:hypothetical protein
VMDAQPAALPGHDEGFGGLHPSDAGPATCHLP